MTTIKEHIEAGHYPTDAKGRSLVPTAFGPETFAVICATDKPGPRPIIGWVPTLARVASIEMAWTEDGGAHGGNDTERLLPPPPRKVKVSRWQLMNKADGSFAPYTYATQSEAVRSVLNENAWGVVELTGEYEKQWP